MIDRAWREPPPVLRLPAAAVHVWRVPLEVETAVVNRCAALLSADEAERAARFHFERHRRHFTVARGTLRTLLGQYLDCAPEVITFTYSDHGKPALPSSLLQFNVSHSHELALIAFAWNRIVGVDIEWMRELPNAADIAQSHFSKREFDAYTRVRPELQAITFYNCWTRKEAFIKAIGEGLSYPLDKFEVTLVPGDVARLVSIDGDSAAAADWKLIALHPHQGYAAALIAAGQDWDCVQWAGESVARGP